MSRHFPLVEVALAERGALLTSLPTVRPALREQWRAHWVALRAWLTRPRRVAVLLLAIWAFNLLDLHFTLTESLTRSWFVEANPVAAFVLGTSVTATVVYKATMLALGTGILWWLRRRAVAELASWLLTLTCLSLMVQWYQYYLIAPQLEFAALNAGLPLR
jgi:hypothetical protein